MGEIIDDHVKFYILTSQTMLKPGCLYQRIIKRLRKIQ